MKKLALFDLDGTLYDTFGAHYRAYCAALGEQGYAAPTEDFFAAHCFGHHFSDFIGLIAPGATAAQQDAIHRRKLALYPDFLTYARENTRLFDVIEAMQPRFHLAIVSTASRACVDSVLARFGRAALFELTLAQEDIPRPKPNPEGFLMAMRHFAVSPADTLIFEDSDTGVRAARATGAGVIIIDRF